MYINLSPMIAKNVPTLVLWLHVIVISHNITPQLYNNDADLMIYRGTLSYYNRTDLGFQMRD